jgi:hypothetical protein
MQLFHAVYLNYIPLWLNFIGTGLTPVNSESSDDLVPYIVKNTIGHRARMFPAGLRTRILKLVFLFLVFSL